MLTRLAAMDCMCFDVDSTLCSGEGIDELAAHCGVAAEVKQLTASAVRRFCRTAHCISDLNASEVKQLTASVVRGFLPILLGLVLQMAGLV